MTTLAVLVPRWFPNEYGQVEGGDVPPWARRSWRMARASVGRSEAGGPFQPSILNETRAVSPTPTWTDWAIEGPDSGLHETRAEPAATVASTGVGP